jgi:hypothetical protein
MPRAYRAGLNPAILRLASRSPAGAWRDTMEGLGSFALHSGRVKGKECPLVNADD